VSAIRKTSYRTPYVSADVDVSLDEFETEDIIDYLRHNGYTVTGNAVAEDAAPEATNQIDTADLDHIYTLALAGQLQVAQQEALQVVGKAIGRPLQ
jgi:hypothetical protein